MDREFIWPTKLLSKKSKFKKKKHGHFKWDTDGQKQQTRENLNNFLNIQSM